MVKRLLWLFILPVVLAACVGDASPAVATLPPTPTAVPTKTAESTPKPTPTPPPPTPTAEIPTPQATPTPALPATLSPEQEITAELATAVPPTRDDVRLAIAFRGLQQVPTLDATPIADPLQVGARETFNIPDVVNNTVSQIDAELLAVSDHAYFWFDTGPGSLTPEPDVLQQAAQAFDAIYEQNVRFFGQERSPGLDGDPRLHIVHASPLALCGVTEETADNCWLAGLVNSADFFPTEVDPRSNEREMFIMNARQFGSGYYLSVLAHEFRHMIESNYDSSDTSWEKEGSATLASELLGYGGGGAQRGNIFLQDPDRQLNSWSEEETSPHYGQGYVLNRYIFERLGEELYREFATRPEPGLQAIDAVAAENGLDLTGESLWLDWLAALAIHTDPAAPEVYRLGDGDLITAVPTTIDTVPATFETTVHQYAADYYELPAGPVTINFSGSERVPLLPAAPPSGQRMWYAQRANYSNPRLTRAVDLRDVQSATLTYAVYTDIEEGYDFAYVSVSEDDGRTWQPLVAENMQGLDPADDPAGSALAERFYTGRRQAWVEETIDLSDYAGQTIQLRFEYVTDPILTYGGFALDDIAIPEIGFFDDAETAVDGWVAEGFLRATADLAQTWHLQLITFEDGVPVVQQLALDEGRLLSLAVEGEGDKRPILIIAATAPETLETAVYTLKID